MKNIIEMISRIYKAYKQIVLYLFFGILTTAINTVCYAVFSSYLNIDNIPSTVAAWLVAVMFAFVTNKMLVFDSKKKDFGKCIFEIALFFACRIATGVLDVAIMVLAVDVLKWNGLVWKLISNIIVTVLNYVASKFWIFKKRQ